jgi:hypothetical protein
LRANKEMNKYLGDYIPEKTEIPEGFEPSVVELVFIVLTSCSL